MKTEYNPMQWSMEPNGYISPIDEAIPVPSVEARGLLDLIDLAVGRSDSILDVGCCDGRYLQWLMESHGNSIAKSYIGCDITLDFIQAAQLRFPETKFEIGDVRNLKYLDKSFDLVMCPNVLMHLPSLLGPLRELFRVARKFVAISIYGAESVIQENHSNGFLNYWYPMNLILNNTDPKWKLIDNDKVYPDWDKSRFLYQCLWARK